MLDVIIVLTCISLICLFTWDYLQRLARYEEGKKPLAPTSPVELAAWSDGLDDNERECARDIRRRIYQVSPGANPLEVERAVREAMTNPPPYTGPGWPENELYPAHKTEA